jgi:DNA adenine methylase
LSVATKKIRSPLKWHGGKSYLARRIISLLPQHRIYVEPFFGGGSVLLNKTPAKFEIATDLNPLLVNFWSELHSNPALIDQINQLEYATDVFDNALPWIASDDKEVQALAFLVRNRMSRGGLGETFAWSDRLRGGQPGDVNAWETIKAELPAIRNRLTSVHFQCCPAVKSILKFDSPDTLLYLDPPYLHETRTAKKAYAFEMDTQAHIDLLHVAIACKGMVVLSGYRSAMYDDVLSSWTRVDIDMPNHSGQGANKQLRIECLWLNLNRDGGQFVTASEVREYEEGEECPQKCGGRLSPQIENCTCFRHAPCSQCVDAVLGCDKCGWKAGDGPDDTP